MYFDLDGKVGKKRVIIIVKPQNISEIFDFIKREIINGKFTKKYSLEEKERNYRADPRWSVQLKAIENIYK